MSLVICHCVWPKPTKVGGTRQNERTWQLGWPGTEGRSRSVMATNLWGGPSTAPCVHAAAQQEDPAEEGPRTDRRTVRQTDA